MLLSLEVGEASAHERMGKGRFFPEFMPLGKKTRMTSLVNTKIIKSVLGLYRI